jgi:hypothetical protein
MASELKQLHPYLYRLSHRIGRRGSFLLFLTVLDLMYGYSLLFPTPQSLSNPTSLFLIKVMPLWAWAMLWLAVGIICLICAFRAKDAFGFAAAMFLKVIWGTMFLLGWTFVGVERGYLSATFWYAFAFTVFLIAGWPEPKPNGADQWTRQS